MIPLVLAAPPLPILADGEPRDDGAGPSWPRTSRPILADDERDQFTPYSPAPPGESSYSQPGEQSSLAFLKKSTLADRLDNSIDPAEADVLLEALEIPPGGGATDGAQWEDQFGDHQFSASGTQGGGGPAGVRGGGEWTTFAT